MNNTALKSQPLSPNPSSPFERRFSRTVALFFICSSVIYIGTWFLGYESNILLFLANVFAPSVLLLLLCAALASKVYAIVKNRHSDLREAWVRSLMILSVLVPTVMGLARSGAFSWDSTQPQKRGLPLSVLDANLLGTSEIQNGFYDALERLDPDIVVLQELNNAASSRLKERFGSRYPCQELQANPTVFGMGVLSKYPCTLLKQTDLPVGIGLPQLVSISLPTSQRLTIINVHTIPPHYPVRNTPRDTDVQQLSNAVVAREQFLESAISIAALNRSDASILAGDLNATTRNRVYKLVRDRGFLDSWRAGPLLGGGTWPSSFFPLPSWLVRIDYIFHTEALIAKSSTTLPEGYGSDHRPVFATFELLAPGR